MSDEDFERRMAFISGTTGEVRGELREATGVRRSGERPVGSRRSKIEELVGFTGVLRDALIGLTHHAERHDEGISANQKAIAELVQRGKETDARLKALSS